MTDLPLSAPPRSKQQRMDALAHANDIRSTRARYKRKMKLGKVDPLAQILHPDEFMDTAKVGDYLKWCPKVGRVKAHRLLAQCRISPSKTIGGLSDRQRRELATNVTAMLPA